MNTEREYRRYRGVGWTLTPVRFMDKAPILPDWTRRPHDPRVERMFLSGETYNLGLVLGDIVDVEADSAEANALLESMTAGHRHPRYRSEKSVHHLFSKPDDILTRKVFKGIEFRGRNHQSVLPPSVNDRGVQYEWVDDCNFRVPPMPHPLWRFYRTHMGAVLAAGRKKIRSGFCLPWCSRCEQKRQPIDRTRYDLEVRVFKGMGLSWLCHPCRKEAGVDCREGVRKERKKPCRPTP